MYIYVYISAHARWCGGEQRLRSSGFRRRKRDIYTYIHTYNIYIYMNTYIHTYTYTHACMHIYSYTDRESDRQTETAWLQVCCRCVVGCGSEPGLAASLFLINQPREHMPEHHIYHHTASASVFVLLYQESTRKARKLRT
jgi:hypothetical protein